MQIATGKVIAGRVVVEGLALSEGEIVTVLTRDSGGAVHLFPEDEAELLQAIAEAERGETISTETMLARLSPAT